MMALVFRFIHANQWATKTSLRRRKPVSTAEVDPGPLFPARGRLRREDQEQCTRG